MKKNKLDQGDPNFIRFFFDLFYRTNGDLKIKKSKLLPTNEEINVLICGAGSCVHELPVLLTLFKKYKKVNLTFVDKAEEPFKLLHFILQEYGKSKSIEKNEIAKYFENENDNIYDYNIDTDFPISIGNCTITYFFHVMDLELDPHEFVDSHKPAITNRYEEFNNFFEDKEYDIVVMSMFLQHVSYWRSLIAFLNDHLKKGGYFWVNELGKDDHLLTWDLYMAIIDNKRKSKDEWKDIEKDIIRYFEKDNRDKDQMLFSIISDNDEISPTNTEICRDFFDFLGSEGKVIFEENFQSDMKPSELFEKAKENFSPFTKLHSFIEEGESLSPTFSENESDVILDFTMKWYAYRKVKNKKIKHFNVLDESPTPLDIPALQQYINRTLDILNLNSTIFRPTFLRSKDTSGIMVESAISLFRRFQLFKIGNFHSIVFYTPGIIPSFKCLNDTSKNYTDGFRRQKEFHTIIDGYNKYRKERGGEGSNSALFFDKYKTKMTKPFSIFYEPLDCNTDGTVSWENVGFDINEYIHSPNRKVHIIEVNGKKDDSAVEDKDSIVTPLGVSYNLGSIREWYKAYHKHFEKYRSIFIPCFREPLFDQNKEFLGDLIIFQEKKDDNKDDNNKGGKREDYTPIEFFSWLIRKFIDFTQIATYLDHKRIIIQSIKSAIAALMARNMSHNLGSHPLTNTKNYFRKRIDEVISEDRYNCEDVGADYRGNVHLLQYIKERMDFIATVVSSDQYPFGALNFKAQLFDVLTEDDHGQRHKKRTQNFLLKYLVFSEKLTRYSSDIPNNYNEVLLKVIYNGETYTGDVDEEENEKTIKLTLSNLELAVPGGLMGRHAFFCIIENIARNSAKHSKKDGDLVITIKMKPNKDKTKMDVSVFDNREGGRNVKNEIEKHLKELVILNEGNNRVDKNSKGLKEMLICALWLRNENVAEKLYDIQSEKDGERKLDLIKKYLDVSLVDKDGEKKENEGNLCYTIKNIPLFETCHQLRESKDYQTEGNNGIRLAEDKLVNLHADIVAADKDYLVLVKNDKEKRHLSDIFPRFVDLSKFNKEEREKWDEAYQTKNGKILFKMFDEKSNATLLEKNPTIHTDSDGIVEQIDSDDIININVKKGNITDSDWTIFFKNHLESDVPAKVKQDVIDKGKGKYLESESGENFTSTITTNDFLEDAVNRYKVVEAANTRIAIIDERIYGDFHTRWNGAVGMEQKLLEMRGIYLLNFDKENGDKIIDLQGNEFYMNKNINFVSIHLGLLDTYKKKVNIQEGILGKYFGEKTFVSIHSGRGNFSADLESELKNYPFISLSALEAAFYDCKFFLTQLFKTTNYYGKGNITDK